MIDILFVIGICAFVSFASVFGMLFVRNKFGHAELAKHNDVAGFIHAIIGAIYAVLLAFVVIVEWEIYRDTKAKVETEVGAMASIFRDSRVFSDVEKRSLIQHELIAYATTVVEEEWPLLAGGRSSEKALGQMHQVFKYVTDLKPKDEYEKLWYQELIAQVNKFSDARNQRLLCCNEGIPLFMWWIMILGGLITISFSFLFGTSNKIPYALMVASLSCIITLVLLLIYALDHPFRGIIIVKPDAFVEQLKHWKLYLLPGG